MAGSHAEFRPAALAAIRWVEDYLETVETRTPGTRCGGEILSHIAPEAPRRGESITTILDNLTRDLLPGITHWSHRRFLAYVPRSAPPPAIVAGIFVSALNVGITAADRGQSQISR